MWIRTLLMICFLMLSGLEGAAKETPLYLLIQAKGDVYYSTSGAKWRPVLRNKFLYAGHYIKTDFNGACKLIEQTTGKVLDIREKTKLKVGADGVTPIMGHVAKTDDSADIVSFLQRKFSKVQKYTVVRRSPIQKKLKTASYITLSDEYPDLVWENLGKEYSYQLTVDNQRYEVKSTDDPMVRFTLPKMAPGEYAYHITVFYQGELLETSDRKGTIKWLSENEKNSFDEKKKRIKELDPDNGFLLGNILDENGFKVAAMDQYQNFLSKNPDINEVRPFLIKVYSDLKLRHLKETEAFRYLKARSADAAKQ